MQGPLTREANDAAAKICAAVIALAIRAQNSFETPISTQLEDLRWQMNKLRHENQNLRILLQKMERKQKTATARMEKTTPEEREAEAPLPQRRAKKRKEGHGETSLLSKDREASPHREKPGILLSPSSGGIPGPSWREDIQMEVEETSSPPATEDPPPASVPCREMKGRANEERDSHERLMAMLRG